MTEEIKEILSLLNSSSWSTEARQIEDYITNLQQDLEKANDIIEKDRQFYKCRMEEYVDLKKENERLKEENKSYQEYPFIIIEKNGVICSQNQEIERLNNIINGIEKYLEEQSTNLNRLSCSGHVYFMYQEDLNILNKLKELKEGE